MPSVIYVAIGLPGFIRCPVDANPPVALVKWKKDGLPLRIDKVSCCGAPLGSMLCRDLLNLIVNSSFSIISIHRPQYPGWSQMDNGNIRVAEVTEDSLGTYMCMPYNALGSMGWSPPAPLVLKVRQQLLKLLSCIHEEGSSLSCGCSSWAGPS